MLKTKDLVIAVQLVSSYIIYILKRRISKTRPRSSCIALYHLQEKTNLESSILQ